MGVIIKDIEYFLPENVETNIDLSVKNPSWDMGKVFSKTGVLQRHIAARDETALNLGIKACEKLFKKNDKNIFDTLIFCTQTPDYIMPGNAYLIHKHFAFKEQTIVFDINQACSGYIYGLFLAKSLILSGAVKNVLLINADTYSKYIHPGDRSTRALFGDGAAATHISADKTDNGIIDTLISSSGNGYENFFIPSGGCKVPYNNTDIGSYTDENGNTRSDMNIHMNGMGVLSFFRQRVPAQIKELLKQQMKSVEDVDAFIFHQASKVTLDYLSAALKIDADKMYSNIHDVGNLVSASIPVALKMAIHQGRIKAGDHIVISGFGVGLSWGSMLIKI